MTGRVWTLMNAVMLLLFLFAAAVQVNDPDPAAWIAIYVAAAAISGSEIRRRGWPWLPWGVALAAFLWAGSLYYRARDVPVRSLFAEWEMQNVHVEEAREMYGLLIIGVWMVAIGTVRLMRARAGSSVASPSIPT
jgi:hypothetical protein